MPSLLVQPLLARRIALCLLFICASAAQGQVQSTSEAPTRAPVLTKAPALLQRVPSVYPEEAKAEKLAGDVTLQVDISADGHVAEAKVIKGAGHGFDEAALAAVKEFLFSPAELDGKPAAVRIQFTEHFVYAPPPPPPEPVTPVWPVSLTGRVLERATRVPLFGALVRASVDGIPQEPVETDGTGRFALRLPPGVVQLEVYDDSHETFRTHETVKQGEQLDVTYYLLPTHVGVFETVVKGEREKKEVTRRTLQREELESVPGSFGDPLRVLLDLPGVARTPYSIGGIIVRGAPAEDTTTQFNGMDIPLVYHFGGGPSVVNPEFLDRIDFYPGGFDSHYGRAIGGAVDIISREPKTDDVHGSLKIDLIDTGAFFSAPVGDWTVALAARRSYIDAVLALVLPHLGTTTTIAPSYYDYQAELRYHKKGSRHTFTLFFMGSNDILDVVAQTSGQVPFQVNDLQGFQRLAATWSYQNEGFTLRAMPYFGFDQNSFGVGTTKIDSPATVYGFRGDFEKPLNPIFSLRGGLDLELYDQAVSAYTTLPLNYRPFPGAQPDAPLQKLTSPISQYAYGEWLALDIKLPHGLKLMPSLRLDEFRQGDPTRVGFGPRLTVRDELGPKETQLTFKASAGLYSEQAPAQYALTFAGNPNLALQQAFQTSAGVEKRFSDILSLDVTGFYSYRFDLAVPTTAVIQTPQGVKREFYSSDGIGNAYGLEVFLKRDLTPHLFAWLAYTLSWSQQRDEPGKAWYYTTFDERHILTLLAQYRFSNGWALGGRFRLTTGTPATPVIGATYLADRQAFSPIEGPAGSGRTPPFNQLDVRVDKVWLFNRWQLGAYLDVQNVYNRRNPDFFQYDYRFQTKQAIPDIPFLPTLGLKGTF
jgi:TonB family protein